MEQEQPSHFARWISLGDIVTLIASLVIFAYGYGSLSKDVDALRDDVATLMAREITPGAQAAISSMQAVDRSQSEAIAEIRAEMRESRREMIDRLDRIETALQTHDRGR